MGTHMQRQKESGWRTKFIDIFYLESRREVKKNSRKNKILRKLRIFMKTRTAILAHQVSRETDINKTHWQRTKGRTGFFPHIYYYSVLCVFCNVK